MRVITDFDYTKEPSQDYYWQGSNPKLLECFLEYINKNKDYLIEINIAWYLFNNPYFLEKLEEFSKNIKINVVSIPIDGYDGNYPKNLIDYTTKKIYGRYTKEDLAKLTYNHLMKLKSSNLNLYIFPHMYVRSSRIKKFSRGRLPYSLHTKSFNFIFKDGSISYGLTSSNFATRDEFKDNFLVICQDDYSGGEISKAFFKALIANSTHISQFDDKISYLNYQISKQPVPQIRSCNCYIAPFYKDSPHKARDVIIKIIKNAKKEIYICAQHVAGYTYYENGVNVKGIMYYLVEAAKRGIKINILSQTFVDSYGNSHGQRLPANTRAFSELIAHLDSFPNVTYYVNSNIHSKYMIIDDWVVMTTCNFTPTEFIYIDDVNIQHFDNMPNLNYRGTFSEVGQFIVLKNPYLSAKFVQNFLSVATNPSTYVHKD